MTKAVELLMGLYNTMVNNGNSEIKSNRAAVTSNSSVVMSSWKITGTLPTFLTFEYKVFFLFLSILKCLSQIHLDKFYDLFWT